MQKAQTQANADVRAGGNEVKDPVQSAEPALAQSALLMDPIGIDHILGKGRRDQNRQDPWKRSARGAAEQSAGNEEKVGTMIEGPAKRASGTCPACHGPV